MLESSLRPLFCQHQAFFSSVFNTNTTIDNSFGTFIVAAGLRLLPNCSMINTNTTIDDSFGASIVDAGLRLPLCCAMINTHTTTDDSFGTYIVIAAGGGTLHLLVGGILIDELIPCTILLCRSNLFTLHDIH